MRPRGRPISITALACVYIMVGVIGAAYHFSFRDIRAQEPDIFWIELTEFLAVLSGAFLLRGRNWARWLALAWMAFHVILSFWSPRSELIVHAVFCALIAWLLFRPAAARYFDGQLQGI